MIYLHMEENIIFRTFAFKIVILKFDYEFQ